MIKLAAQRYAGAYLFFFLEPLYLCGIVMLILQAFFWQIVLTYHELSRVYMATALYYPGLLIVSYFIFGESVSYWNLFGTIIIAIGTVMLLTEKNR
jgi:drug/metabolite transporter (DMT)-like permease